MNKAQEKFIEELNKEHEIILGFQEYEKKIADLEAKLAESEKELLLAMSKLNIKEHQPSYCKLAGRDCECMGKVEELKQQLAEKDKELEEINREFVQSTHDWKEIVDEKIKAKTEFAIQQLQRVKEKLLEDLENVTELLDPLEYDDYHEFIGCGRGYKNSIEEIDQIIKELKGE